MTPPPRPRSARVLKVRRVAIDTYRENVAYLHRDCSVYRTEGFRALSKIEVTTASGTSSPCSTSSTTTRSSRATSWDCPIRRSRNSARGRARASSVGHAERPASLDAVRRKIAGERLDQDAITAIVADIAANHYSKTEIAAFIVATVQNELDRDEILYLTRAMVDVRRAPRLAGAAGRRQALHRRHSRQPHVAAGRADRRRARHADSEDVAAARSRRRPARRTRWRCSRRSS